MKRVHGGVIHTYLGYDPVRFPPPSRPPADAVSAAMDHMLAYGSTEGLTPEQMAEAIEIDPESILGLGPSLQSIIAMLEERRRRILETWETTAAEEAASRAFHDGARALRPPPELMPAFDREVRR